MGATRDNSPIRETARQNEEAIQEAASGRDSPAGVAILAAYARGEEPPQWALDDLEERL